MFRPATVPFLLIFPHVGLQYLEETSHFVRPSPLHCFHPHILDRTHAGSSFGEASTLFAVGQYIPHLIFPRRRLLDRAKSNAELP
jgi:hypothetical protein